MNATQEFFKKETAKLFTALKEKGLLWLGVDEENQKDRDISDKAGIEESAKACQSYDVIDIYVFSAEAKEMLGCFNLCFMNGPREHIIVDHTDAELFNEIFDLLDKGLPE